MNILVDTGVWSVALRRDSPAGCQAVSRLKMALQGGEGVVTTGPILQELLQGFNGPKARRRIIETFSSHSLIIPEKRDHIDAADLRVKLGQKGIQAGTIDVLLVQLCLRQGLSLLSMDKNFVPMRKHVPLSVMINEFDVSRLLPARSEVPGCEGEGSQARCDLSGLTPCFHHLESIPRWNPAILPGS